MPDRFVDCKSKYLLILFCCLVSNAFSQQEINFTSLTTKDGLSSNTVNAILKDKYGLMWFATADGLDRFDGTNVTVFRHDQKDTTSLPSNEVMSLFEDHAGRLWVGTNGGGVTYYDRNRNAFVKYRGDGSWPEIKEVAVRAFCEDANGNLWVAAYKDLRTINLTTGKIVRRNLGISSGGDVELSAICLFMDSHQRVWIGTSDGLYQCDRSGNILRFAHESTDKNSISSNIVRAVAEDHYRNLWFGTFDGLNQLLPNGHSFRAFTHKGSGPQSLSDGLVYTIAVDGNDKLWLGTESGVNIFDPRTFEVSVYQPNQRNAFSLTHRTVSCIFIDKEGISWLGTFRGGVNKFDRNFALFNIVKSNAFDKNGLAEPVVTSFTEYAPGKIFVGTDGGGLHLFDRKSGLFDHFDIRAKGKPASNLSILALAANKNGKLWIGTFGSGLFFLDPATRSYRQYVASNESGSITGNDIFCIKEDSKGNVWVGTNGQGISVYNPQARSFTNFKKFPRRAGDVKMPLNGFMRAIAEDADHNIWLASFGSGVGVYHPVSKTFSVYTKLNSGLANDAVLTILTDSHHQVWVGTNGSGLCLFNQQTHKFKTYSEKDGLANGFVYKILEDKNGIIWVSTDKGISSFNPLTNKFKNFSTYNGLQYGSFVLGAGLLASTGEMFFGGQYGFNYFKPANLPESKSVPDVFLTELKVANNTVVPGNDAPIKDQIGVAKEINLGYGQNFSIGYVGVNYTTPQQNQYSYKLVGYDKDWNLVGASTTAYYTNLDPGNYVFQVRAGNYEGQWNNTPTTIIVNVLPPFWRTIYAYIIYALAAVSLLLYLRRRGIAKLKREFARAQEKEHARLLIEQERREAERLHELDLLKIKFLTNLSHEFRTPISLILAPADKLLSVRQDTEISGQVQMIRRNARRLLNLVNQLLDFRTMEENELKLNLVAGNISTFIQDAADSFNDLAERKRINYKVEINVVNLYAKFDHDKIERIVFNLLSNAFKFTHPEGTIKVEVEVKNDESDCSPELLLKVSDTGVGIPEDVQRKVFDRFFQSEGSESILNQGSGIGLSITAEFVQLQGGEIGVESKIGEGTVFYVSLPLTPVSEPAPGPLPKPQPEVFEDVVAVQNQPSILDTDRAPVLLVEDNDDFRFYLKDNLKAYYHIIEASNGKEGWQKALSCHPQLIVSDISMPYMDGIELSKKIKSDKRTSHIPVILLTAITGEQDQIIGLESGASDYLTKPFNFEILNAKIKNLLLLNRSFKDAYSKQIQVTGNEIKIESTDARLLNVIVRYIEEKLNDPELSVEELSKHVGMSRGSLYHKVLELTGLSPIEYIRSVKLERATAFLEKSDYNVAQIAYMTGFGTPSYFSKMFKAKYKVLPSEYMAAKRKDAKTRLESIGDKQYS
jgi:signal transduction histidine kinase/ligand-binding sensor domain-containing protein/DNA-binding response OmpR family regulator